jgi:PKD repeat protein
VITRSVVPALVAAIFLTCTAPVNAATLPPGWEEETLGSGLTSPVGAAPAPDGRIFVAEKGGRVRVIDATGALLPGAVLDISSRVNSYWDRGLLGIAVDRDFASNGWLYLLYTYDLTPLDADSSSPAVAQLLRVTVSPANVASQQTVLLGSYTATACPAASNTLDCIPSNGASHSIGTVRVDPDDGTLWVGVGDSASFTQVDNLAFRTYDERSLAGKLLHVDRNGRGLPGHPFCPTDGDLTHVCTKVHAKGLRNPYRFHLRADGPPIAGDVQWDANEEVDLLRKGANLGWPCWEAKSHTPGYRDDPRCQSLYAAGGDTKPLLYYPHADGGDSNSSAVVGGPELDGAIYYGDYAKGFIRRIRVDAADNCLDTDSEGDCVSEPFATHWFGGVDLQSAPGGGLLYVEFGDGGPNGSVKRIFQTPSNLRPIAAAEASPRSGAAPLRVEFDGSGSRDPEGAPLTYRWDFGDGGSSTQRDPTHTYTAAGSYTARLTVSDGELSATDTVTITPGNSPPAARIAAPLDEATYRAGQTIQLRGSATDPEDGTLPGASMEWRVTLVHGSHDHPLTRMTGAQASFVAASDHDSDSYYRVTLRATDSTGLDDERTIELRPQTVPFRIWSASASGAEVTYGGLTGITPYARESAIGYRTTVSAETTYTRLGVTWLFDRWSDRGARLHDIVIPPVASTLTASYREDKAAHRPATASSSEAGHRPDLANDVTSATRWSSTYADGEWWQVDLGYARKVDAVEINWEAAYASRYRIQTSTDGSGFSTAAEVTLTGSGVERTSFPVRDARYVRVLGVDRATQWGISFHDVRVLGPQDRPPPPEVDKARGRPSTASSTHQGQSPAQANDGTSNTRWSSAFADGQWWQVDLGSVRRVESVELNWDSAYASTYKIQISTDGVSFADAATVSLAGPGFKTTTFSPRPARYVRVLALQRATNRGIGLWDARVFGPDDVAPPPPPEDKAAGRPATASSVYSSGFEAGLAVDDDLLTRWSSTSIDDQWWQVDLGRARAVDAIELDWEAAFAHQYRVQTSLDGSTFADAAAVTISTRGPARTEFPVRNARYVRVLGTDRATAYGISFWNAQVFGPPD